MINFFTMVFLDQSSQILITIDQVGAWDNTIHMCVQLGIFHIFRIMGMFEQDYTTGFIKVEMQAEHGK